MSASIDSRTLQPGDVFYALRGEHSDGNAFVEAALTRGASAAVVAAARAPQFSSALQPHLRVVDDPLRALQDDARQHRRQWGGPLVAITGSAGKTTTKEMIAAVLGVRLRVLKSGGNYNNHLGVPLTLLALEPGHEVAVVEMGMSHAGEIAALAAIAEPTVGVFTNVGSAHLGNFSSIEGIAEAKRELARAIPPAGALVLNRDDVRVAAFGEGFRGRICRYSACEYTAPLLLPGLHNRANAAAALAVGTLFAVERSAAEAALATLPPLPGRGETLRPRGMTFLHDCYNANPEAMVRMLAVLAATPGQRRIAVLGEMRELGVAAPELHRQVGAAAVRAGVDALWAVGGAAQQYLEGAAAAGFTGPMRFTVDAASAAAQLRPFLRTGDTVLFKGSRAVHLEDTVLALIN
ncbi:MAG: UDP-N-acetylmuramoyl-tripeptide--D-alanyl-D-alanine ligase [Terriglobales bacterium]